VHHGLAFGGGSEACITALLGFPIERLCHRRRATNIAEQNYIDFKVPTFVLDLQEVTDADVVRSLRGLLVTLNSSELTSAGCHGASFEEPRSPEPFVETHARHDAYLITAVQENKRVKPLAGRSGASKVVFIPIVFRIASAAR
jgi:hypothetical protein